MARSPAIVSIGSPGMMRMRKNASKVSPMKVGIARPIRASAKRYILLLEVNAVKRVPAERTELEVDHFLAHRLELDRMGDREPRRLFLEDDLSLPVEFGALSLVAQCLRLDDQLLEWRVAELCGVGPVGPRGIATQQAVQEIIGIAIVAGPAELSHHVLAVLDPLAVFTPFEALDLGLDADFCEVGLHQLGDAPGVRIIGPLDRHRPQVGRKAVRISG